MNTFTWPRFEPATFQIRSWSVTYRTATCGEALFSGGGYRTALWMWFLWSKWNEKTCFHDIDAIVWKTHVLENCLVDRLGCNNVCVCFKWQREVLCFRSVFVVIKVSSKSCSYVALAELCETQNTPNFGSMPFQGSHRNS